MRVSDFLLTDGELLTLQVRIITVILIIFLVLITFKPTLTPKFIPSSLKVNINTADINRLQDVPYIGEKTANLIIEMRNKKGYFKSVEELKFLPNFDKFKDYIKTED
ncbi:MAG: helix-hairpin-helix domain-containing protein [Hydrogenothermaceae bacterium]|nr:helix-hairpin-helix domain-containing protein [Hydrogenothermaceae bacterium]